MNADERPVTRPPALLQAKQLSVGYGVVPVVQ
jgi:hypothetical protein